MENLMEKIISLAKRRGFIFQSSEIYGGCGSCYDFGPLGVELKNNIKKAWWKEMTRLQDNIVGLDAAILMNPKVWQASGHLTAGFADELVECKKCHRRFRKDFLESGKEAKALNFSKNLSARSSTQKMSARCPDCGGELTKPRKFNLMMKTFVGPVEDEAATTYLRPETCQGIYVNFQNVLQSMRQKVPFGIAQIGKAFRNEITPKDFIYRTREFEQMEMQWFCSPAARRTTQKNADSNADLRGIWTPDEWFDYWAKERINWYIKLGIKKENLRVKEVKKDELPHYAKKAVDIEYKFPFGWKEIEGVHNRGDWDLSNHAKHSGQDLRYFDPSTRASTELSRMSSGQAEGKSSSAKATEDKYFPHVIETSAGADRSLFAFLCDAYQEVKGGRTETTEAAKEVEVVLKLHKSLSPVKAAILPLVKNKPEIVKKAKKVFEILKPHLACQYDEAGTIGRRYRRQDEIGTTFAITVDFETLEKDDVTVRDRDTMKQKRVKIKELIEFLKEKLEE